MEAHVGSPEKLMSKPRKDMLARMLRTVVKTCVYIERDSHGLADSKRRGAVVDGFSVNGSDLRDGYAINAPGIGKLSAALGKEGA